MRMTEYRKKKLGGVKLSLLREAFGELLLTVSLDKKNSWHVLKFSVKILLWHIVLVLAGIRLVFLSVAAALWISYEKNFDKNVIFRCC